MALDLGAGLWFPLFLAALFVLLPESLAFTPRKKCMALGPAQAARHLASRYGW